MRQKLLILLLITSYSISVFSQTQQKFYYDSEWKGTSKNNAEFYRVFKTNENGDPVGEVKDYFISGELQSRIDGASYIDKYDDSKSIFIGFSKGYFKSGNKEFEILHDKNGQVLTHKIWYENGNLRYDATYKDGDYNGLFKTYYENGNKAREIEYSSGVLDGTWLDYYETGKLYRKFVFKNGVLTDKFFIECDEFGKCQKVFYESFANDENINDWQLVESEKDYKSSILPEKGLLMETKTENGFRQTINIPLSLTEDFSIETIIDFKSGEKNNGHGLIWGFKDWDNYYYFYISANGYYLIGGKTEGINIEIVEWTESNTINQDYQRNQVKILRVKDKMYFSINGSLVHSEEFYGFRGNYIGFSILSGKKSVLFENLIVKQDLESSLVADNNTNSDFGDWKGNGTGFFISKDGYIATNYHVIAESSEIEIEFIRNGQKQNYKAKVIQSDKFNDLAILKVDDMSFSPFSTIPYNFKTSITDVGSNVFALGFPMALTVMGTEIKFTDGKISSKTGFQGDISTYQMTTPIQPGNSGGPLFDFDGNLIGVNSAKIRADVADNVSYAIKSSYLKNLIDVLPTTLDLPNDKSIMNTTLTEKIKIISDYVVLIRIK
ncbi:MAG: trypsin-like peptidase domain-containing protein [Bacteroidales bacterium]|jgi:S1-C subfamily serine protease/antitoxin component YwqK of YwqJK toxin-antitoxin module|nr:trypsin-like peptidase domain-containing protein [Bacteroidales bacterium]